MAPKVREQNPYVGPRPFERQDKGLFFGRDREASEVLSLVIAHRVLLVYAQSGAGKTSLINAGLIPLLEEEGFEVLPLARVQGLIPQDIQPEATPNLYTFNALMSWAEDEADPKRLSQMSLASFLKEREHPTDEEGLPSLLIVIFDQFEELFTFYQERWQDREGVFEQVHDALEGDPLLRVVFVMREDYIAQLDPYAPLLPEKLRTRFRLERLRKRAALLAVTAPLAETKLSFAEGVAEQLVEELLKVRVQAATGETVVVTGEFIEPVQLQVVCQSLWRDLPPEVTKITQDHLQAFGDVNQALSGFYERSISRAAQETGVKERILRPWFERSLITSAGTRGMVYRGPEETGGIPNQAVRVLENLHLIRGEWRAGARWYELTHDRLIEPIQGSNKVWKEKRRRTLFTALGTAVAVLIVGVMLAFARNWTIQQREIAATVKATEVALVATAAAADSLELGVSELRGRVRPLRPGLSLSTIDITAGTLGAFVRDAKGHFYLLTALNSLGGPECELGSPVVQPGPYDGGTLDDVVGYVAKCLPFGKENLPASSDVGLAGLREGVPFETVIPGIGPIRGVREPTLGMNVRKVGRTTGLTTGRITQVDATVQINYGTAGVFTFVGCVEATGMSAAGDAGALVVDEEGYAVGIIFAGSQNTTILAPIQDALDRLDVELVGIVP